MVGKERGKGQEINAAPLSSSTMTYALLEYVAFLSFTFENLKIVS
jgi:hypothetical protein